MKRLVLLFLGLSLMANLSAQTMPQIAKHELGVVFHSSDLNTDYSLLYKHQLKGDKSYIFARLDLTSLSFDYSNTDSTKNGKSVKLGGTIGLEFRQHINKKKVANRPLYFVHGPELSYGIGNERLTPAAPKTSYKIVGGGYGFGLKTQFGGLGRNDAFNATLQYIPGIYKVTKFKEGILQSDESDYRFNQRAFFLSLTYCFNGKKKK